MDWTDPELTLKVDQQLEFLMVGCDNVPYFLYPPDSDQIDIFWENECKVSNKDLYLYSKDQNKYLKSF